MVPDRANHPKRMVGKVFGAMKNAGRFAAAVDTRERERVINKCPDCLTGKLTHDITSGLDQCENRTKCGYGWNDRKEESK
jgi:uncharacterized protein (DUF983 family)